MKNYTTEEVEKILARLKRKVVNDRKIPKRLLGPEGYPEGSHGRERAFGEVNVLNGVIYHINDELRVLKKEG
jgi:hypothetical protein